MAKVTYKGGKDVGPIRRKERRYWWRYLLVFISGMLTTLVVVGVTTAILGSTYRTKELIYMFGGNPDEILQEEYQNLSILELVTTLSTKKFETLGDINSVTPLVKKTLDEQINPVLENELHYQFPWEEISIKPFKLPASDRPDVDQTESLDVYIGRAIKEGVTLSSFINGDNVPELINLFLYPRDGEGNYDFDHPYTLMDFISADSDFFNNIMNGIRIKDVVEIGTDPLLNEIGDWKITDFDEEHINNLSLGLFLDSTSTNPLIVTLSSWTISDLKDTTKFDNLLLGDLITIDSNTPKLLIALIDKGYTIGMLQSENLYYVLKIEDVFDTDGSKFLEAVGGFYLSELEDENTILNLKLGDVLSTDDPDSIVARFADTKLIELTSDEWFSSLRLVDVYSADEISGSGILSALVANNPDIKVSDLSNPATIQSLTLADVLDPTQIASNPIINALKDYQIDELASNVNNLTLGTILEIDTSDPNTTPLMMTLASTTIGGLSNKLDNLTLGDVMDLSSYPNLDNDEVRNTSINDFDSIIDSLKNHLKLSDVVDIVEDGPDKSPQILIALKDTPLLDLADTVVTLTLGQILSPEAIASHPLLQALENVAILDGEALVNKVNNLELCDIYTRSQCSGILLTIWDSNDGHTTISDLPAAINNLPLVQLLEDYMYEPSTHPEATRIIDGVEYRRIKAVWWFLFTEQGETFTSTTKFYKLGNGLNYHVDGGFDQMVTNMTYHMQAESIRDLNEAGLLNLQPGSEIYFNIPITYKGESRLLGDLNISEFFDYCMSLLIHTP